jgi:hypothetical protein
MTKPTKKRFKTVDDMVVEISYKPETSIKYLRNKIKRLEAIAQRAGDVNELAKVVIKNIHTSAYGEFEDVTVDPISLWLLNGEGKDGGE